jgi:ribokinase
VSGRVIVVGSVNVDLVVRGDRLPGPGETVTGGTFERHHGGKGANQAVAAARLGASTSFVGLVGDDDLGADARAALEAEGVDVSALGRTGGPTGVALILVASSGENMIGVASGANWRLSGADVEAAMTALAPGPGDVVLASNEIPAEAVRAGLATGRRRGAATILNPAPATGLDADVLALADVLTPNATELGDLAAHLTGSGVRDPAELASALLGHPALATCRAVVVTLGAAGAILVARAPGGFESVAVPAQAVDAIDATGAGDAFAGCLAASLAASQPLEQAVRRAVAAGSITTTRRGARTGLPTADQVAAVLALAG